METSVRVSKTVPNGGNGLRGWAKVLCDWWYGYRKSRNNAFGNSVGKENRRERENFRVWTVRRRKEEDNAGRNRLLPPIP